MTARKSIIVLAIAASVCFGAFVIPRTDRAAFADVDELADSEFKIATVDVLAIVARMLESDAYKQSNLANAEKYDAELRRMLEELEGIRNRALAEPDATEARKALEAEFLDKNTKFEQARATAQQAVEQFNTDQVAEAYRLVCDAANSLAQTLGYTHVIVSRGPGEKINSNTVAGAVQEILARPVIRSVKSDDLTEQLVKSFKLESIPLPGAEPPAAETPK
ncbi:MAG: OmpH family outer membrane protein [Phycisphaerales bacterium]